MPNLLEKLKSLKHLNVDKQMEESEDVQQTPSDPSVRKAAALLEACGSASPSQPAGQAECDVYQTPTSQAVKDAEADVGDLPDKGRATSFISSLTSRISRAASFHASHSDLQKLDTSAAPRARTLAFSKSQPDLKAAMSVGLPPAGLVVLGKEARRRSRRYVQSEDGTLVAQHPEASAASAPGRGVERERRHLSRKISSCKLVISTDPLEEKPGDIMLNPEVVEFASGALAALGGHYTGEIQFSGKSARVARRMSQRGTRDQDGQPITACVGVGA
ncbi:hypothetical protein WJX75_007637 [Coccomyxa subellipsoidea]|uniref:Uncharacterized protein n=1 Tax=Coccomyxa subellipsoidea TaxID=248742 RepID=A0ABR2YFP3_9CHLO